eukprot:5007606-Amphidinium_carterae.2
MKSQTYHQWNDLVISLVLAGLKFKVPGPSGWVVRKTKAHRDEPPPFPTHWEWTGNHWADQLAGTSLRTHTCTLLPLAIRGRLPIGMPTQPLPLSWRAIAGCL